MDQIPTVSICSECETYVHSLISGKQYSVTTHFDKKLYTINALSVDMKKINR